MKPFAVQKQNQARDKLYELSIEELKMVAGGDAHATWVCACHDVGRLVNMLYSDDDPCPIGPFKECSGPC